MKTITGNIPSFILARPELSRQRLLAGAKVGDVLKIKVLKQLPDGKVILDVKGLNITANSKIPVQPGQKLEVKIANMEGEIVLKRISSQEKQGRMLKSVLALRDESSSLAKSLKSHSGNPMMNLPGKEFPHLAESGRHLMNMMKAMGLDLARITEPGYLANVMKRFGLHLAPDMAKKLMKNNGKKDTAVPATFRKMHGALEGLQSNLARSIQKEGLRLASASPTKGPGDLESLLSLVKDMGKHMEKIGLMRHFMADDRPLYLEIPFLSGGEAQTLKIRYQENSGQNDGEQDGKAHFDMFFDLREMGRVRVNILLNKKSLSIHFQVENPEAAAMLKADCLDLENALLADGLQVENLRVERCIVSDPQMEALQDIVTLSGARNCSVTG